MNSLDLIELIAIENIDSGDIVSKTQALEQIYKIIHVEKGKCKNNHNDWKNEIEQIKEYFINK